MPKTATTYAEKENLRETDLKLAFNKNLKSVFSNVKPYLDSKKKNNPQNTHSKIINEDLLAPYTNYFNLNINERIDRLYNHYQAKFEKTNQAEYNIKAFHMANSDDDFIKFIHENSPSLGEPPKGVVFCDSRSSHCVSALISNDNKVYVQDLSGYDFNIKDELEGRLQKTLSNKKVISCVNQDMPEEKDAPQQANSGCDIFAFKYLKALLANNCALFNQLQPSSTENEVCILPPDLLKYAQSETVVKKAIANYEDTFKLSQDKKQEIINYRKTHFDKLRILYFQFKHFQKSLEDAKNTIEFLNTLSTKDSL